MNYNIVAFMVCLAPAALAGTLPAPFSDNCIIDKQNLYPPKQDPVPWYTINLDDPAETRWQVLATDYKDKIVALINVIKELELPFFHGKLIAWVDKNMGGWDDRLPQPYADELKGIAKATGLPLGEIVLYNVFYEIFTVCTSIVAQDPAGKLYHARNLDFGLFLGWNSETHDWMTTERLRDMIVNIQWTKNGKPLYKSVNFAGFVGIYNGLRPQRFTITANERFNIDGGYLGIIEWLLGSSSAKWMTWLTRDVMEQADSYDQALKMLVETEIMSPVYFIIGGNKTGQGAVVTRSREKTVNIVSLNPSQENGWYVLETNYDPWEAPLYLDNRRTPGNNCMRKLGQSRVNFEGIFNVLSSPTTLNKLTAYSVLMQVDSGAFETYIQKCPDPCWAW